MSKVPTAKAQVVKVMKDSAGMHRNSIRFIYGGTYGKSFQAVKRTVMKLVESGEAEIATSPIDGAEIFELTNAA